MASKQALKGRAGEVCKRLVKEYPDAKCRLNFSTPFELLVATILAAQCTDDKVNEVTPALFKRANTPEAMARMRRSTLETLVRPTGFFRNKSKAVQQAGRAIRDEHGGTVPKDMNALVSLPGVARKTANVVRAVSFGLPAIVCDTHLIRLSRRMGLTKNKDPNKIERDLMDLLPEEAWSKFSHAMLFHGRAVCQAKKPACDACVVRDLCPSAFRFPHFKEQT